MFSRYMPISIWWNLRRGAERDMIILGIDPGTRLLGYGVIETQGNCFRALEYGTIQIDVDLSFPEKLVRIHHLVDEIIQRCHPDEVAVEESYVTQNAKTTLRLGHARGVILLAAAAHNKKIGEYAPRTVKQAVCGSGRASKDQIKRMVASMLGIDTAGLSEDASDALAISLCHALRGSFTMAILR